MWNSSKYTFNNRLMFLFQVSLLLGTIIRKIPLPSSSSESLAGSISSESADMSETPVPDAMFDMNQLKTIGDHFLEILLKMKHNGAIDKTRAGFTALCNRLLCSNDPRYAILVFILIFYFYFLVLAQKLIIAHIDSLMKYQ